MTIIRKDVALPREIYHTKGARNIPAGHILLSKHFVNGVTNGLSTDSEDKGVLGGILTQDQTNLEGEDVNLVAAIDDTTGAKSGGLSLVTDWSTVDNQTLVDTNLTGLPLSFLFGTTFTDVTNGFSAFDGISNNFADTTIYAQAGSTIIEAALGYTGVSALNVKDEGAGNKSINAIMSVQSSGADAVSLNQSAISASGAATLISTVSAGAAEDAESNYFTAASTGDAVTQFGAYNNASTPGTSVIRFKVSDNSTTGTNGDFVTLGLQTDGLAIGDSVAGTEYYLPVTRGTDKEWLISDGSGTLTFQGLNDISPSVPEYANLAAAQAALGGAGLKIMYYDTTAGAYDRT